jgi:hypothetical protein
MEWVPKYQSNLKMNTYFWWVENNEKFDEPKYWTSRTGIFTTGQSKDAECRPFCRVPDIGNAASRHLLSAALGKGKRSA